MRIATSWSTEADTKAAFVAAMGTLVDKLGGYPNFLLIYFTESYPADELRAALDDLPPWVKVQGCTTCLGVMTEEGLHNQDGRALGMMGICDENGAFGVGTARMGNNPRAAAQAATEAALADSARPGELPDLIWLNAAPGNEELVLKGIQDVVGTGTTVAGGSAADNAVAGRWRLLTRAAVESDAVVVSALFPSFHMADSLQSGYLPAHQSGIVTSASGRTVHTIDHRPAAEVYRTWTDSLLAAIPAKGGNILSLTSLAPLGRVVGTVGGVPYYTLSHPDALLEDGSLRLFTEVEEGQVLTLMTGSKDSLVSRAGRVVEDAVERGGFTPDNLLGGMVVYCAGCMLTVQPRMSEVVAKVNYALAGKPFIGIFTFGEQGCLVSGQASHGNLMISTVVFGR